MNKKYSLLTAPVCLVLVSCGVLEVQPPKGFDQALVGTWYCKTVDSSNDGPKEFISGIKINEDSTVDNLAIETSSGKLVSLLSSWYCGRIVNAIKNGIEFKEQNFDNVFMQNIECTIHFNYQVGNNILTFSPVEDDGSIPFQDYYSSTDSGARLAEPVVSFFKALDYNWGDTFTNNPIGSAPSAYSYKKGNCLIIKSSCGFREVQFEINGFNGVGKYDEKSVHVNYSILMGDFLLDYDSNTIDLSVDTIDNSHVVGTFDMTANGQYFRQQRFSDGEFTLPIY
jgi:hypothetical protein